MKSLLKRFFLSVLALFLLFEEWLWNALTLLSRKLSEWLHLARLEAWLEAATPYKALVAFFVPVLIVTPINLAGLHYIAKGMFAKGIAYEAVAKLLGTVMITRVFALTKTQLLTFRWFSWLYHTVTGWLKWAHESVQQTSVYKNANIFKARAKEWAKAVKDKIRRLLS